MSTFKLSLITAAVLCAAGLITLNLVWINDMEQKRLGPPVSGKKAEQSESGVTQSKTPRVEQRRVGPSSQNEPSRAEVQGEPPPQPDSPAVERDVSAGSAPETSASEQVSTSEKKVPPAEHASPGRTTPDVPEKSQEGGDRPARSSDGTIIVTIEGKGGKSPPPRRLPRPTAGTGSVRSPVAPVTVPQHPTSTTP